MRSLPETADDRAAFGAFPERAGTSSATLALQTGEPARPMNGSLLLVYEPEAACRTRLARRRLRRAARARDLLLSRAVDRPRAGIPAIAKACAARGLDFLPVELDDARRRRLPAATAEATLVWTLTDGIAYFRGGAAPALARLNGLTTIGADDSLFALCQDKFRSGAVLAALGLPVAGAGWPATANGWSSRRPSPTAGSSSRTGSAPRSASGRIRTAATLGRGAGAQPPRLRRLSRRRRRAALCGGPQRARELPGRRAGRRRRGARRLSSSISAATSRPWTDSLALYGETGARRSAEGRYAEPELVAVDATASRRRPRDPAPSRRG